MHWPLPHPTAPPPSIDIHKIRLNQEVATIRVADNAVAATTVTAMARAVAAATTAAAAATLAAVSTVTAEVTAAMAAAVVVKDRKATEIHAGLTICSDTARI